MIVTIEKEIDQERAQWIFSMITFLKSVGSIDQTALYSFDFDVKIR